MAATPQCQIDVTAADNELIIIASTKELSSVLCHLKSGFQPADQNFDLPTKYTLLPHTLLPSDVYDFTLIGINWGGPASFEVAIFVDGKPAQGSPFKLLDPNADVGVVFKPTVKGIKLVRP